MHNNKDFKAIMNGLQSARNIVNSVLTPEIRSQMTTEQLKELDRVNKETDPKKLQKMSEEFFKMAK